MAKSKHTTGAVNKAVSPDAALIRACISYAQATAAHQAAFAADPDANNTFAEGAISLPEKHAAAALRTIAATKATTVEGLQAKARILPMILRYEDADHLEISAESVAFFRSFAADVLTVSASAKGGAA